MVDEQTMGGSKKGVDSKSLFPDSVFPDSADGGRKQQQEHRGVIGDATANGNDNKMNYGSTLSSYSSCFKPLMDEGGDEEKGETSFLIDAPKSTIDIPSDFPACVVNGGANNKEGGNQSNQHRRLYSDISNISSGNDNSISDGNDDSSSAESGSGSEYYDEDEIEQPHRTLGLIFFDFLRLMALSASGRCVNTQIVPVFLAWGKMDLLDMSLR